MWLPAILTGPPERRLRHFIPVWIALTLCQFWQTRRLWLSDSIYPQIPWMRLPAVPNSLDAVCFALLLASMVASALFWIRDRSRSGASCLLLTTIPLAVLLVLNQHRLQPWAYLFWLSAIVLGLTPQRVGVQALRALMISVYLYSAWSKFDFAFLHGNGPRFISTFFQSLNLSPPFDDKGAVWAAAVIPIVESVVAMGLIFRPTRRISILLGLAMHACMLLILGPLGMHHSAAVLLWNVVFIWALPLFYWPSAAVDAGPEQPVTRTWRHAVVAAVALMAIAAPLTQSIGGWDHWPSWALYANRNSRARIYVTTATADELPEQLAAYLQPATFDATNFDRPVRQLDIKAWSLRELGVPVYPQSRFQLAVALAIGDRYELDDSIFVQLESASDRIDGSRKLKLLEGMSAIREAAAEFNVNMRERFRSEVR